MKSFSIASRRFGKTLGVSLFTLLTFLVPSFVLADHVPEGLTFDCHPVDKGATLHIHDSEYFPAVDEKHQVILIKGKQVPDTKGFRLNDGFRFKDALKDCIGKHKANRRIDFTSGGGAVPAAFEIAQTIAEYGFHTHVPAGSRCVSACTLAFLGGFRRTVDPQGTYEVHSFSGKNYLVPKLVEEILEIIVKAFNENKSTEEASKQLSRDLRRKLTSEITQIERDSALLARNWMQTVQERRVSARLLDHVFATTIQGVRPLTREELKDLSVITDEAPVTD